MSECSGRVNLWIGKERHQKAKEAGINMSQLVRNAIDARLSALGIVVPKPDPKLILLVGCINCGNSFETSGIKIVRCPKCQKAFRVYTKKGGSRRMRGIVRGTTQDLHRLYAETYRRSLY